MTFYVAVDDRAATPATVEARGALWAGATALAPIDIGPDVAIAQFSDPDGNVVGLAQES